MTHILSASQISRRFQTQSGETVHALDHVTLTVEKNDFACIAGPSGCGKSTLLRIIAGLESTDTGQVMFQGQPVWQGHRKTVLFVAHSVDEAIYLADRIVLMSTRPGRVGEIMEVAMARPRRRSDPAFGRLADYILHRLEAELMGLKN